VKKLRLISRIVAALLLVAIAACYLMSWKRQGGWFATVNGKWVGAHVFEGSNGRLWITFPKHDWESDLLWDRQRNDVLRVDGYQSLDLDFLLIPKPGHGQPNGVSYSDQSKNDDAKVSVAGSTLTITVDRVGQLVLKYSPM
jgi:hypothetical protein